MSTSTFLVAWAIDAAAAIAVFVHADKRGSKHATAWGAGVFLFLIPVLPIYIFRSRRSTRGGRRY
jgi:hypothetical protein